MKLYRKLKMSLSNNKILFYLYWPIREILRPFKRTICYFKSFNKKSKLPKGLVSQSLIKRVAFFVGCPDNRSERYRVDNIVKELEKRNIYVDRYFEFELKKLFENPNYDILVIFRANKSKHNLLNNVISLFKSRNIPVVYDTDDLIFNKDVIEDFASKNNFEDYQISRLMTNADLYKELLMSCNFATTTTQYLANQIEKQCGIKTFVIKNTINSKQFELAKKLNKKIYKTTNKIKICYLSGTATHNKDFKEVEPVLLRILAENKNVEFHIVGPLLLDEKFNKFKNQIKRKRYMSYLNLLKYTAQMDINIAPLEMNNPYNEGKSELKIFESALVKVPSVVSAVNSYSECIQNGVNGYLANNADDWYKYLSELINNKEKREIIGQKAYDDFVQRFYIGNEIKEIIDIYENFLYTYHSSKNRVCVFAHYDKNNLIQDYVLYYLKELKKICKTLIFVSDSNIGFDELQKLENLCDYTITERHCEYDFGSYKRGYFIAKEKGLLSDADELIFANDSCYGPLYDLSKVFKKMEAQDIDFWGITENNYDLGSTIKNLVFKPHIQSYFIVFNKKIFDSEIFDNFMKNIKKEKSKNDVIKNYEIGLSSYLTNYGFEYNSYCEKNNSVNIMLEEPLELIINGCPFLKTSICRGKNPEYLTIFYDKLLSKYTQYPVKLIKKDLSYNLLENFKLSKKQLRKLFISLRLKDGILIFQGRKYKFDKLKIPLFTIKKENNQIKIKLLFIRLTIKYKDKLCFKIKPNKKKYIVG